MDEVLEKLKAGIRRFRTGVYPAQAAHYQQAVREPQRPAALIVTCADSRVHPDTLTQSVPGEIFVTRNIGNIVPAYGEMMGGVSAVLEYAVSALQVRHVVVCGHTDCGAMKALLDPASVETMPTVKQWMTNAQAALTVAEVTCASPAEMLKCVTQQNVLLQMLHVRTHPSVAAAMAQGRLTISGWLYDVGQGEVSICEGDGKEFVPVEIKNPEGRRERIVDAALAAIGQNQD